jgi:transmembrane sensor
MTEPESSAARAARIDEEARAWLIRLQSSNGADQVAFEAWFSDDPEHAAAYESLLKTWHASGMVPPVSLTGERHRSPARSLLMAIAAVLVIMVGIAIVSFAGLGRSPAEADTHATRIGEIRTDRLADGSTVTLDTDTRVEAFITKDKRALRVLHGRVRITVAVDPARPFLVDAPAGTVIAAGTSLDVDVDPTGTVVTVNDGITDVRPAHGDTRRVVAGQVLALPQGQMAHWVAPTPGDAHWPSGMLTFDNAPLSIVTAAANRYNAHAIVLPDSDVAQERFSGTFKAADNASLVKQLSFAFRLSVKRDANADFVLTKATAPEK